MIWGYPYVWKHPYTSVCLNRSYTIYPQRNHAYIHTHIITITQLFGGGRSRSSSEVWSIYRWYSVFHRGDESHTQTDTTWLHFGVCSKLESFKTWIIQIIWELVSVGTWTFRLCISTHLNLCAFPAVRSCQGGRNSWCTHWGLLHR